MLFVNSLVTVDGTGFGDLLHGDGALVEGLVGQVIVNTWGRLCKEWEYGQPLKANGVADSEFGKSNGHGSPPREKT